MIVITGTVRIPAGTLDRARPAFQAVVAGTRAEEGCLHYGFAEDLFEPGLIWVSESWRDAEALEQHAQSLHMAAWRETAGGLGVHDVNLTVYEAVSAKPL